MNVSHDRNKQKAKVKTFNQTEIYFALELLTLFDIYICSKELNVVHDIPLLVWFVV